MRERMAKKKIKEKSKKLWGGRFQESMAADVEKFTASIHYDVRLALYDIFGSIAHVKMLYKIGILTKPEAVEIDRALDKIASDIASGKVKFSHSDEDIHMAVEGLLIKRIGKVGEKLHTARSRNDQVALDMRLYLKACTTSLLANIRGLQKSLLTLAKKNAEVIIPEYTHLQHAQPVLLSHHLLAYMHMLDRDVDRLQDGWKRIDVLPLGAGACTGTSIPIDQKYVAGILGFKRIKQNSVDAVSDRDFVIEYLSTLSLIAMHLSRFSEEMILWATDEFGFISIGDDFSSGSSMMPQKKNPDICELIRGKTGRVYGALVSLLTMMKGLPLTYNRDMQEDKEPLFDAIDTVFGSLKILTKLVGSIKINKKNCEDKLKSGYLAATDAAEYLVKKGIPFREAHHIVGRLVHYAIGKGLNFEDLGLNEFQKFSKDFGKDIAKVLKLDACVRAKVSIGGTSHKNVQTSIRNWEALLKKAIVSHETK